LASDVSERSHLLRQKLKFPIRLFVVVVVYFIATVHLVSENGISLASLCADLDENAFKRDQRFCHVKRGAALSERRDIIGPSPAG
jgi:hypothetical protein